MTTMAIEPIESYIEAVDSNNDLTIQCATIQNLFEHGSPNKNHEKAAIFDQADCLLEDNLRRHRGTIIDNKTKKVVKEGSFFPYEFTEDEQQKCKEKMDALNHKLEDMDVEYSYEGTIIRIFYYKQWYISTHRKLDSGRSKWGSTNSFKFLFEEGLKESYNMSLKDLFTNLNLRCEYTFMVMADENTRFVCSTNHPKKVYFLGSNDPDKENVKIDGLPKPYKFNTLDDIFGFVKGMKYPFNQQGLLLVHKNGSQYRIISNEYSKLFKVRNNEPSIPYRYLQLKSQNDHESIDLLKKLFPKYIETFESYNLYISKLVDIIYLEYNKRKQRSLLPADLTSMQQIDQRLYLFIKNKLLHRSCVTQDIISELLWSEEPSNLNHMIRMVKFNDYKEKKLILELEKVTLNPTPLVYAPKKKRVKYTPIPVEFTCKKKLF